MNIPLHKFPVCIDYFKFIDELEKEKGYNTDDFSNKFGRKNYDENVPYQDFWHWMLEGPFCELQRGGVNYLSKEILDEPEELPEFVKIILTDIFEAVKDHPAFDCDIISFYVNW